MCVIIHKPRGVVLSRRVIEDSVFDNPDGFGLICLESGVEFKTLDADLAIDSLDQLGDGEWIFHARIRTHGEISEGMSHPFIVNSTTRLMHNGMLSCFPSDAKRSDTWYLAQSLRMVNPKKRKAFLKMLSGSSRFALIDMQALSVERIGTWVEHAGAWHSNDCSISSKRYSRVGFSNTGYNRWQAWYGDDADDTETNADRWSRIRWHEAPADMTDVGGEA